MRSRETEKVIERIRQSSESNPALQYFAILDAARDERIYYKLVESEAEAGCLYRGDKARELARVSPYLVPLQWDGPLSDWLFTYGWGNSWGIIVESTADFRDLRRHFQSFVMVYTAEGIPLYFRYYDPRVLRIYLPTCNEKELRIVFGPVGSYYVEGLEPRSFLHYSFSDNRLMERKVQV